MAYEFECSDVIPGCSWSVTRDTKEDTVDEIERHAEQAHNLAELPDELADRVLVSIQPTN